MDASFALLASFVVLLILGLPIAVALGLAGVVGILSGLDTYALGTIGTNTYNGIAKYPLIAIPLFVLTGMIFERSGVAGKLVEFASALVGPRRGGLAVVAVLVCMLMGGMSGSGPADAAAVATVMIPSMAKAGYPRAFSAGGDRRLGLHRNPDPAVDRADRLFDHGARPRFARAVRGGRAPRPAGGAFGDPADAVDQPPQRLRPPRIRRPAAARQELRRRGSGP